MYKRQTGVGLGRPFQQDFLNRADEFTVFPDGDFIDDGQQVLVARLLHFFCLLYTSIPA